MGIILTLSLRYRSTLGCFGKPVWGFVSVKVLGFEVFGKTGILKERRLVSGHAILGFNYLNFSIMLVDK